MPGDSAINNTTELSEESIASSNGTIGTRNFSDYNAREISSAISRQNYRDAIVSDSRMQMFRKAVFRMVQGWLREDKLAIITEYGDAGFLSNKPSDGEINKICTESIIIHLTPEDLQTLYNDIAKREKRLLTNIKNINGSRESAGVSAMARANRNRRLTLTSFKDMAREVEGANNEKEYESLRKKLDPDYGVPITIRRKYRELRSELNDVLSNCFNKFDINQMLIEMDIDLGDKPSFKEIKRAIINKTVLYVDLMVGKGKIDFAMGAISDVEPYNRLLKMTSYSYVTGEPGLDPAEWLTLRKEAREAKAAMKERAKMQNNKRMYGSKEVQALTGRGRAGHSLRSLTKQIKEGDSGILKDASYDQLLQLAGKYGIDPTAKRNMNLSVLKAKIYNAMGNEIRTITKLNKKQDAAASHNKHLRSIDDILSVHNSYSTDSILGLSKDDQSSTTEGGVPVITLNRNGDIKDVSIDKAVPVYIVGSGHAGVLEKETSHAMLDKGLNNIAMNAFGSKSIRTNYMELAGIDVVKKEDLSDEDRKMYSFVIGLDAIDSEGNMLLPTFHRRTTPNNAAGFEEYLKIQFSIMNNTLQQMHKNVFGKKELPEKMSDTEAKEWKLHLLWLWAALSKHKKLQDYLSGTFGIFYKVHRNHLARAAKAGITRPLGLLFKPIIGGSRAVARLFAGIKNESDLDDDSKEMLSNLRQISLRDKECQALRRYLLTKGYSKDALDEFWESLDLNNGSDAEYGKLMTFALYAEQKGNRALSRFCKKEAEKWVSEPSKIKEDWKKIHARNKFLGFFRGARDIFKEITGTFKKRDYLSNGSLENSGVGLAESNEGGGITKSKNVLEGVKFSLESGISDKNSIDRVLPVYIMGMEPLSLEGKINRDYSFKASILNPSKTTDLSTASSPLKFDVSSSLSKAPDGIISTVTSDATTSWASPAPVAPDGTTTSTSSPAASSTPTSTGAVTFSGMPSMATYTSPILSALAGGTTSSTEPTHDGTTKEDIAIESLKKYGSNGTNHRGGDKTNSQLAFEKYKDKFGVSVPENRLIEVTNPDNIREMNKKLNPDKSENYNVSKNGKKYRITKASALWAIENNKQFATGGSMSFMTGDSLNGRPNPEIVTIKGNGSIDVNPLKAGPENGNSPYALNRFATGGTASKTNNQYSIQLSEIEKFGSRRKDDSAIKVLDMSYDVLSNMARQNGKDAISSDAYLAGIKNIAPVTAIPTYSVNNFNWLRGAIADAADTINETLTDIMIGLGSMTLGAPMGVGVLTSPYLLGKGVSNTAVNTAMSLAKNIAVTMQDSFTGGRSYTGSHITALPKFATGGTMAITGDSAGSNIFAHGAKPEIVKSNGDLDVIPLNKTGTERKQKIVRMTDEERRSALAAAISSHVIKYRYNLPDGAEDVSNIGEAIKVFDVKPGITDTISVNGDETSIAQLLSNIYQQLLAITSVNTTGAQLLTKIAEKPVAQVSQAPISQSNPFTDGFPSNLDGILGGE